MRTIGQLFLSHPGSKGIQITDGPWQALGKLVLSNGFWLLPAAVAWCRLEIQAEGSAGCMSPVQRRPRPEHH